MRQEQMDKQSFEFEALKWVIGPAYYQKRDEWLQRTPDVRGFLLRAKQSRDFRTSITAEILLGWLDHRREYDALSRELHKIDWIKVGRKINSSHGVWDYYRGRASPNQEEGGDRSFGERMLPRCWEVLLKDCLAPVRWGKAIGTTSRDEENTFAEVLTYHAMLGGRPDPRSIEPVMWFLQNVDPGGGTHELLSFPPELVQVRIARLLVDQDAVFEALQQHLNPALLPARRDGKPIEVPEEDATLTPTVAHEPEDGPCGERPFEFDALAWVGGPSYTKHRDASLASTPDARALLNRCKAAPFWRTSMTASTLLGWLDHRAEYEALVGELNGVDWDKLDSFPGGRERVWERFAKRVREDPAHGERILPLAWEVVLGHHPEWRHGTRVAFFEMLREHPDPRSIEPLFWFLENLARDQTERDLAARALARMPVEPLERRVARLRIDQWAIRRALTSMRDELLPGGDRQNFLDNYPGP